MLEDDVQREALDEGWNLDTLELEELEGLLGSSLLLEDSDTYATAV
jgi:hypothetical protein